ncbi:MAG: helix-turn-helix transcriptional regulator [Ruminococcus sp.]|nr:helix-turn-helix transcriptional regulator [Ruminococcus sp.]
MKEKLLPEDLVSNPVKYREPVIHGIPRFPMRVYENDFSWYTDNIIDWHWHPEVEFAAVLSGRVECHIGEDVFEAGEGEGFFINSNTMHMERPAGGTWPHMVTVCFMPEFIGDCGSDLIYEKYIEPVLADSAMRGKKLSGDSELQGKILAAVKEIFRLSNSKEWGYEFRCRNIISELWYRFILDFRPEMTGCTSLEPDGLPEKRLKDMLNFIHENYRNELTVSDIARSANISLSECFRCFRRLISSQPMTYLNEYRLKKAAELLISTDMQVTEVCFASGFNHISYFGKVFRRHYGVTPGQFRRNEKI